VVTRLYEGALQPTETSELTGDGRETVGWFGSLLHSSMFPGELAEKPLPVIVTDCPLVRPVSGLTVIVASAKASLVRKRRTTPPINIAAAAILKGR